MSLIQISSMESESCLNIASIKKNWRVPLFIFSNKKIVSDTSVSW